MKTRPAKAQEMAPARWSRAQGGAALKDWQPSGESLAAYARGRRRSGRTARAVATPRGGHADRLEALLPHRRRALQGGAASA